MCDKMARLGNVLFGAPDQVGESVEDTVKDLANYSDILLQAYREKRAAAEASDEEQQQAVIEAYRLQTQSTP
jgi:aspartate carbamoyltransferase catalytic subunit